MILNFYFDELYYFVKPSTCMSLFEKKLKLIKKTKPSQTNYNWFGLILIV